MKKQGGGTVLGSVLDWRQLLVNWSVPCPACRQVGILRTEEEHHYECRHCGDTFDIRNALSTANALLPLGDPT